MSDDYREDERFADERDDERQDDQYADEPNEGLAPLDERRPRRRRRRREPEECKKVAAGVLAILLGAFGVHKFYLGMTTPAVIMLSISLVGMVGGCACLIIALPVPLFATSIMSIIGLVEGIIYLTKTDQEFIDMYQIDKKEWF